jgi:hypothetical protein
MNLFHAGDIGHGHIHGLVVYMYGQSNADRRPFYRSGRRPDRVVYSVDSADMQVVRCSWAADLRGGRNSEADIQVVGCSWAADLREGRHAENAGADY